MPGLARQNRRETCHDQRVRLRLPDRRSQPLVRLTEHRKPSPLLHVEQFRIVRGSAASRSANCRLCAPISPFTSATRARFDATKSREPRRAARIASSCADVRLRYTAKPTATSLTSVRSNQRYAAVPSRLGTGNTASANWRESAQLGQLCQISQGCTLFVIERATGFDSDRAMIPLSAGTVTRSPDSWRRARRCPAARAGSRFRSRDSAD